MTLKPNNLLVFALLAGAGLWYVSQRRAIAGTTSYRPATVGGNAPSATGGVSQLLGGILGGWLANVSTPASTEQAARESGRAAVRANDPYYGSAYAQPPAIDYAVPVDQPLNDIGWWSVPATGAENHRQEW